MTTDTSVVDELTAQAKKITLKHRAMEAAPIGITIADMTQPDEPLIYANEGFERITGYGTAEIVGRNCRFMQGEETDPERVAQMREAIERGESVKVTLRNYRNDGTMFWNEVTLAPIPDEDGSIPYYVGFQQDVTTRKEYETQLREQRDGLDTLNAMFRHDIRNDLQLVLSAVEMLRPHVDSAGEEQLGTALTSIHQAIDLTRTARDMAEVLGRSGLDNEPIPLATVVREQVDEAVSANQDANISVRGTIPQVDVLADGMLGSVFRNLLTNAIVHSDRAEPTVEVTTTLTGEGVRIEIADDGPGIPPDRRDAIFERGEKGADSDGTGLGLYLVRTLVESYGGSVHVEESDLGGATFVVELRLADVAGEG